MYGFRHWVLVWALLLALAGAGTATWAADVATGLPLDVTLQPADPASGFQYSERRSASAVEERYGEFRFRCPDQGPQTARPNPPDTRVYYGCPMLVEDESDYFGNLDLAIDPDDHTKIAFFSLHGTPAQDGPTSRSRDPSGSGSHTTFTSPNAGTTWSDQPFSGYRSSFGEEAAGAIDSDGHIYIGYLWSTPRPTGHTNFINLYKAGPVDDPRGIMNAYEDPWTYDGRDKPVQIQRLGLTRVTPADPGRWQPSPDENDTEPANAYEVGEAAVTGNLSKEVIVATWHVTAKDWRNSTVGMGRWIDIAWTDTGAENEWSEVWEDELIGPCMNASKPVAYRAKVYVACSVDRGYDHTSRAKVGDIHVWSFDPETGKTELMGDTYIRGLNPLLAVTPDGYFVVAAYEHTPPHDVSVQTAYGWFAKDWSRGQFTGRADLGPALHRMAGYRPLLDAHVTNLVVTEREKTVYLLYGEWNEPQEADPQAVDPGSTAAADKDLQKILYAFNECNPHIANLRMNHTAGTVRLEGATAATSATRATLPPGAFNDAHDGFVYARDTTTDEELVYFALNDHGVAQFGAIVVGATGDICAPMAPLPIPPAVPVPAAISTGTGAMIAAGSSVGVVSSLMIGYLLTVKRRTAQFVSVEDR